MYVHLHVSPVQMTENVYTYTVYSFIHKATWVTNCIHVLHKLCT